LPDDVEHKEQGHHMNQEAGQHADIVSGRLMWRNGPGRHSQANGDRLYDPG
jgi:hypothetical protein